MENIIWKPASIIFILGSLLANDTLLVDLDSTRINWTGRKVTGEHSGNLNLSTGWVIMEKTNVISGKLIFDMSSIKNTDIESKEWREKLENHLKAKDFFYVDSFPYAILEIKGNPSSKEKNTVKSNKRILADLTVRGITHEIIPQFVFNQQENHFIAEGSIDIDRTMYNIQYKSGKYFEGLEDKMIYDDFTVQFMIHTQGIQKR